MTDPNNASDSFKGNGSSSRSGMLPSNSDVMSSPSPSIVADDNPIFLMDENNNNGNVNNSNTNGNAPPTQSITPTATHRRRVSQLSGQRPPSVSAVLGPIDIQYAGHHHQHQNSGDFVVSGSVSSDGLGMSPSPSMDSFLAPRQRANSMNGPKRSHPPQRKLVTPTIQSPSKRSHNIFAGKNPRELLKMVKGVVKNRTGSVLGRQMILKSEHFDIAVNTDTEFYLQGAPNFRLADCNVYGVAQPTIVGLSTILTMLNCHPDSEEESNVIWFSAREEPMIYLNGKPFVLREEESPLQNIRTLKGISAARLEQMEARLKEDILREAKRCNGLLLVHDELENHKVVPSWIAADIVQTPREVFDAFQQSGYRVKYVRIPISPEQAPEDRYVDEYVDIIKNSATSDSLVFNCGMGVGRTTFAMVVALLIRRAQLVLEKEDDPFPVLRAKDFGSQADLMSIEETAKQHRAILRLVYVLEKGLESKMSPRSAIEWALARGQLIDDLRNAIMGNYQCILQLASVLHDGGYCKKVLDQVIDRADAMTNLREVILMHRVHYSNTAEIQALEKALGCLERYFFLLSFSAYVNETLHESEFVPFSAWFKARPEIWHMLEKLRKKGPRLYLFRPVEDLSVLSESHERTSADRGSRPFTTELEKYVIKVRQGTVLGPHTILKVDHWSSELFAKSAIEGAPNFRRIGSLSVYALAQPTIQGIKNVVRVLRENTPRPERICWINLREEPLIYINSLPYVLRDQYFTLRNIKSYSGITAPRLELMEAKLKEDIVLELQNYDDRLLLHGEAADGKTVPVWEDVAQSNILTLRDVVNHFSDEGDAIDFHRVPITAETPPDEADFDHILEILCQQNASQTAIVLNCQVGHGRSTTGTVVASLVLNWLSGSKLFSGSEEPSSDKPRPNYQITHSLLRVIRNGLECKRMVDEVVDNCGAYLNLRDSIEQWRIKAENETDENARKRAIRRGLLHLKRYFLLITFQAYLDQTPPTMIEKLESFRSWVARHQEFKTMREDLEHADIEALVPVEKLSPGDGIALTSEVLDVVNRRDGGVLAQHTIIKYDMFPGCQKLTLQERIDGAPNFRRISLGTIRGSVMPSEKSLSQSFHTFDDKEGPFVCGVAMPTKDGIKNVLVRNNAELGSNRRLLWTCLREEPVLYVNGRPYVLRLFQDPLRNLEATGITRERVEMMENNMKRDVINELRLYGGRLLLHEEEVQGKGFSIVPVWETVKEEDVQTPMDVFKSIEAEGYRVDYLRLPITDEQAPIPDVFDQIVERILGMECFTDAIFNCQMGRGRTTTGMVITCLMEMIVGNESLLSPSESELSLDDDDHDYLSPPAMTSPTGASGGSNANLSSSRIQDDDSRQRYIRGEYKLILQLIGALQYGKLGKKLTDKAIDACEHLQNLRKAIHDYKLRVEASEVGSRKHASLMEVGLNYLVRYAYLITFASYLLEETVYLVKHASPMNTPKKNGDAVGMMTSSSESLLNVVVEDVDGMQLNDKPRLSPLSKSSVSRVTSFSDDRRPSRPTTSFGKWLADRREIVNILKDNQNEFE